jgi:hypothetical protein
MDDKTAHPAWLEYLPEKDGVKLIYAEPPSQISVLTTKVVEQHIDALAEIRGQLEPPVPESLPHDQPVHVTHDPIWLLYAFPQCGGFMLHLRHPGVGWLHFVLSEANAGRLALAILNPQHRDNESGPALGVTDKGFGWGGGCSGSVPEDEIGARLSTATAWERPLLVLLVVGTFVAAAGWFVIDLFFG